MYVCMSVYVCQILLQMYCMHFKMIKRKDFKCIPSGKICILYVLVPNAALFHRSCFEKLNISDGVFLVRFKGFVSSLLWSLTGSGYFVRLNIVFLFR
ncbi:hypothetical protein DPEC_G00104580 [Dallia pectoralis]|uniref:Uncharacterized protein n=1 Tax=Dallia pectoralis TaxID=75939 RepID=A0ACC2GXB6_DALPE|nr:hypothetical protein DPEC_G00104580 [Dallia pectoralis]